ncbi:OmpA family protein [Yeosuana sp.]|uniref:OmpA family protein n=1 Tax=Yeosuana sp. TaxID=2529388 RepID=UPI004055251C|tara:strand:+ start:1900 stop:3843 length:1944 start_codon:yes stop_codon:yes gene_type:complete
MKIKLYNILFTFLTIIAINSYAQKGTLNRATQDYNNFSYVKTTEILLDVANKGFKSVELFQKLGNSFYFNNKMEDAAKWYGELMKLEENIDPEYYYRYAQALKSIQNYSESDKWIQKFAESIENDNRANIFKTSRNYLKEIELQSEDIELVNLPFNSPQSDFGTAIYASEFVFASSRGAGKNYIWNNKPFLELYSISRADDGTFENLKKFNDVINTKYHESSVAFTPDGKSMYFTRNNFFKSRLKRDDEGVNRLQLYAAKKGADATWEAIKSVHFNDKSYSVAHPTINSKGDKLIFASDMPGTLGQSDLYVVDINSDGTLGTPINLGASINTEAQETFPFINEKGDLYFSSNGYTGLGGLDIYRIHDFETNFKNDQSFSVENIGKPINSPNDDFAYYENLNTKEGYFSSNRAGGQGDDDIYSFRVTDCTQKLAGKVFDEKSNELLTGAKVMLLNNDGEIVAEQVVDDTAIYNFETLRCDSQYLVRASKDSYETSEKRIVSTSKRKEQLQLDMPLVMEEVVILEGTNLKDAFNLNPIYFDLNKSNIRPDAAIELQKIVAVLNKYPTMKIEVRSHTDSRASRAYNKALSTKRSNATIDYLVEVGNINADRLSGKGYGESELINKCSDGVRCSKEEHQLNRRSDFIIVKM